jgi:alpha-mannosidase
MRFTADKLAVRIPEIIAAAVRATHPLQDAWTCPAPGSLAASAMAPPPPADAPGWRPLRPGALWGGPPGLADDAPQPEIGWGIPASGGGTHWLRAPLRVPDDWRGQSVLLELAWDGIGHASLEAIVYLDGQALAGLDEFHRAVLLPPAAHAGAHELLIRCYTPYRRPFGGLRLHRRDETIFRLGHAMRAMLEAHATYRESDIAKQEILTALNRAYNLLDLREGYASECFAESARRALAELQESVELRDRRSGEKDQLSIADRRSPTVIATGHAHLDIAWLWPLWRTRQKVAHTVATALHLMERYPEYTFSMSQPQVYAFLKEDDPALYERMKQRVAEGRFEPVGMMWLEPDCNVTGGESLVRQLVHGARFFAQEFGELNHIVWLPDVFGYSAALPQLLRGVGISCFMTTKISWSQYNRMPYDTFRWRGIDGSEVLTHFITASDQPLKSWGEAQTYTYNGKMSGSEVFGLWNHYRQKEINHEVLYAYGWGDGGGGPTEEMLEAARVFAGLPGFPRVVPGRVDGYFARLYERVWHDPRLPTWVGELYLEYHRGTYTTQARTKQQNRQAEQALREAEWLNAWAVVEGALSAQPRLDEAWRLVLLNQFHDILPGSSIAQVYVDSDTQYAAVRQAAGEVAAAARRFVLDGEWGAGEVEAGRGGEGENGRRDDGEYDDPRISSPARRSVSTLAVWNALGWERRELARIPLAPGEQPPALRDDTGAPVETQLVEEQPGERALLAEVSAPAFGYSMLEAGRLMPSSEPMPHAARRITHVTRSVLENDELRLVLDDNGEIASLYDKRAGREVILPNATANQLVAYEDRPLWWNAWDIEIYYEEKPYPVREIVAWEVAEEGPLRAAIRITRRLGASLITQRIALARGARRVDFLTEVDWQARQMLLRALFPLHLNAERATCEIQFGAVERPTHRNTSWDVARFEVCAHRWVDISEDGYGVALLNDGKYGHSLRDTTIGLSLLRGAVFPDHDADRGRHRFTYSLYPHSGDWRAAQVVRRGYELNVPLCVTNCEGRTASASDAGRTAVALRASSFVVSPTDHIVVETVKAADDGDGLIIRLYEAHNRRGPASLHFGRAVASAVETDLLECERGPLEVQGEAVYFSVRPFEVKTLRVRLAPPAR